MRVSCVRWLDCHHLPRAAGSRWFRTPAIQPTDATPTYSRTFSRECRMFQCWNMVPRLIDQCPSRTPVSFPGGAVSTRPKRTERGPPSPCSLYSGAMIKSSIRRETSAATQAPGPALFFVVAEDVVVERASRPVCETQLLAGGRSCFFGSAGLVRLAGEQCLFQYGNQR